MSSKIRLYFSNKIQSDLVSHLTKEQSHYVKDVMRLEKGGYLSVFNVQGEWSAIIENYDLFFIDLWGVVHNGVKLNEKAIDVLEKISEAKKNYILLTNAPRPNSIVKIFLEKMGMNKNMRENVYTSGEAALSYLKKNFLEQSFYHIGPPRDFDLFFDFKKILNTFSILLMFLSISFLLRIFLVSSLPEGSPIKVVPPPSNTIG